MSKGWIMFLAMITIIVILPIYDIIAAENTFYPQQTNDGLWSLCKGINNSMECAEKIENYQFKKGVSGVSRTGKKLIIVLQSGKKIIFTDSEPDDSNGKWYQYREYFSSITCHLIHLQYYEGEGYIVLNANNGKYEIIEHIPSISPGRIRIAVISYCDAYCNPGIEIYKLTDKDIIKEYSRPSKEYWFSGNLQWLDDNNIKVTIKVWSDHYKKTEDRAFFLFYADNGWKTKGY
jgi:hypothetical protein